MTVKYCNTDSDAEAAIKSGSVFAFFKAEWSGPCKSLKETVINFEKEFSSRCSVVSIDIDMCQNITKKYNVTSIPYFAHLENGAVVKYYVGPLTVSGMKELMGF